MARKLFRIVAPHFVAGFETGDRLRVLVVAPIIKYMRGWDLTKVVAYCDSKGWLLERVA
jgi:hypothetical protein